MVARKNWELTKSKEEKKIISKAVTVRFTLFTSSLFKKMGVCTYRISTMRPFLIITISDTVQRTSYHAEISQKGVKNWSPDA